MTRNDDIARIGEALTVAAEAVSSFNSGAIGFEVKSARGDELTEADKAADRVLREVLPRDGEGWLSEESVDDPVRLRCSRVWVVDPIDGTREFVQGLPEWCISIGLVEGGVAVAGGIYNPVTEELVIGSLETGVEYNGRSCTVTDRLNLEDATILASRSETKRGEWERFSTARFTVRLGGLQDGSGSRGPGRRYVDSGSEERVGCRCWYRLDPGCRWCRGPFGR